MPLAAKSSRTKPLASCRMKITHAASWTHPSYRFAARSRRRAIRPNWAQNAWQRATAQRIRPTPGCRAWPRWGASMPNPAAAARSVLGWLPDAPSAHACGRSRASGTATGPVAAGGLMTNASSTAWVWTRSLTGAALTTAPSGLP